jgi:hypothetical protein
MVGKRGARPSRFRSTFLARFLNACSEVSCPHEVFAFTAAVPDGGGTVKPLFVKV